MKKLWSLLFFVAAVASGQDFSRDKQSESVEKNSQILALTTVDDEGVELTQPLDGINFIGSSVTCVRATVNGKIVANCTFTGGSSATMATDTLWDAAGDLAYGTGADTGAALTAGTSTQVLHSGTTPSWSAIVNGDITAGTIDLTTKVTGKLPLANTADGTAISVLGRSANSSGVNAPIQCSAASDAVVRESGSVLGCGTIATAGIGASQVTLPKIANATANSVVLGSGSAGNGAAYAQIPLAGNLGIGPNVANVQTMGFDPTRGWMVYDDFLYVNGVINNMIGDTIWGSTNTNSAGLSKLTGEANHPGIVRITGVAGNNAVYILRKDVNAIMIQGGETIEWYIRINDTTASGTKWGCGLADSTSDPTAATDGLMFEFDPTTDAHWQIRNRKGSTGNYSISNSTVVVSTWYKLTIVVNAAANSVSYYVNGTELNNSPLVSNIPTGVSSALECGVTQAGSLGAAALLDIDYAWAFGPLTR